MAFKGGGEGSGSSCCFPCLLLLLLLLLLRCFCWAWAYQAATFWALGYFRWRDRMVQDSITTRGQTKCPLPCVRSVHGKPYISQYLKTNVATSRARPTMASLCGNDGPRFDLQVHRATSLLFDSTYIYKGSNLLRDIEKLLELRTAAAYLGALRRKT